MSHSPDDFIGTWQLIDWRIEYSDGGGTRPFGEAARGYIIYSTDGTMTASIAKAERPPFGIANARNASADQKAAAFDSYFHYAGLWRIEGEDVVHAVVISLNPDMTGTDQRRRAVFDDTGGLTLSASENGTTAPYSAVATRRLSNPCAKPQQAAINCRKHHGRPSTPKAVSSGRFNALQWRRIVSFQERPNSASSCSAATFRFG